MKENHWIWILLKKLGLKWISFYFKIKSFSHFFSSQFFSPDTFHKHKSHFWWIWKFFCRTIHLFRAYVFYNVEYKVQKKIYIFHLFLFCWQFQSQFLQRIACSLSIVIETNQITILQFSFSLQTCCRVRISLVESNGKWRAWAVEIWGMETSSLMGITMRVVSVHLWNQRIFETLCSNQWSPYHIAGVVVLRQKNISW